MNHVEAIARGHAAERELTELDDAFDRVRNAILVTMADTSPSSPEAILKLHMAAQNLSAVRQAMRMVVDNGMMAEHALAATGLTRPN